MSFDTVLIANRGEIAVRIIKACQKLDLKTVAVFSEADRLAKFVSLADKAVHIGASEAAVSYLDGNKIIEAAQRAGAGAIHPGYGFLAENSDFARACADADIAFIGPSVDVIERMGSKIRAKGIAAAANVPVIPGYWDEDQSDASLMAAARDIGTPLMIKASAGGGGRGMRLVDDLEYFLGELSVARQEAQAGFGDPSVLLERYVGQARHIEVQILADQEGHCLHLFERDCSLQRNHQKIIEEAPAQNLPQNIREAMFAAALSLCREIGYSGAGTVEFMVEPGRQAFYFLEMNTRLQVEHPVTEAITGIDIVEWQLRIARGEKLSLRQEDVPCQGWAIEARVSAENPALDYQPETGVVNGYQEPEGDGVRIDSGVRITSKITHYYDSLLAKVIVVAPDRVAAIWRLDKALGVYDISGIGTNIPFLRDLLKLPIFEEAHHHTASVETAFDGGWKAADIKFETFQLATLAAFLAERRDALLGPWSKLGSWRITEPADRAGAGYVSVRDEKGVLHLVKIEGRAGSYNILVAGESPLFVRNACLEQDDFSYEIEGMRGTATVRKNNRQFSYSSHEERVSLTLLRPEDAYLAGSSGSGSSGDTAIYAPMPGLLAEILTEVGQRVEAGEPLLAFEAMKLMQKLTSPSSGIVSKIHYDAGDTPEKGALLLSLEIED
ncbi:MAG: biotin carboxylase N-terminal domain-containing protein [Sneathiella sp.]